MMWIELGRNFPIAHVIPHAFIEAKRDPFVYRDMSRVVVALSQPRPALYCRLSL